VKPSADIERILSSVVARRYQVNSLWEDLKAQLGGGVLGEITTERKGGFVASKGNLLSTTPEQELHQCEYNDGGKGSSQKS
jgi:hypothetical protein